MNDNLAKFGCTGSKGPDITDCCKTTTQCVTVKPRHTMLCYQDYMLTIQGNRKLRSHMFDTNDDDSVHILHTKDDEGLIHFFTQIIMITWCECVEIHTTVSSTTSSVCDACGCSPYREVMTEPTTLVVTAESCDDGWGWKHSRLNSPAVVMPGVLNTRYFKTGAHIDPICRQVDAERAG